MAQTPWRKLEQYVFQLQKRIYRQATGDWKTVAWTARLCGDQEPQGP